VCRFQQRLHRLVQQYFRRTYLFVQFVHVFQAWIVEVRKRFSLKSNARYKEAMNSPRYTSASCTSMLKMLEPREASVRLKDIKAQLRIGPADCHLHTTTVC
jgi:hypothetical protein